MMASFAASLPPPLRRFPRGATLSASHGGAAGLYPLRPRPRRRALVCRADLLQDAPFAAAIGTCVLASLALPPWRPRGDAGDDEGEEGEFSATDMRIGVMEIISFLPYFNWLSWIFAWMDSGKRRYLVYAAVYLSPYLRTNLSLSPEESWLPIASIFICILHIQLEIAIRNYDNEIFQFLIFEVNESFRAIDPTKEYHQHMSLEKGSATQLSLRGGLMTQLTRSETNQTGIEEKKSLLDPRKTSRTRTKEVPALRYAFSSSDFWATVSSASNCHRFTNGMASTQNPDERALHRAASRALHYGEPLPLSSSPPSSRC
ncbi:hypothetical protein PR202_gb18993 [Eleusine coracana subsp. coracana]|uniref:Uncharacterized protein n=1 Tax=Eleusine coracana subsp. coracana TaxID=191504 RepID=A0AAV5F7K9_ELECO|nr:hypothetical protein PR202_gb18993 [Eleusine coracana subsp. coracana]